MLKKLLLLLLGLILAENPYVWTESFRIGFVDAAKVFDKYPETQKATDALNAEIEARKAKIDTLQAEIAKLKEDIGTLKDEKSREKLKVIIEQKKEELKKYAGEAKAFLTQREQELTKKIIDKIHEAIKKVAIKNKISIVIDKNSILYGDTKLDLTDEVIKVLKGE